MQEATESAEVSSPLQKRHTIGAESSSFCSVRPIAGRILEALHITFYQPKQGSTGATKQEAEAERSLLLGL